MTSTQQTSAGQSDPDETVRAAQPEFNQPGPVHKRTGPGRVFFSRVGDPPWARPLLWLLLVGTAVFYLVNISGSGYANDFYAAAVKSSTQSWKAWLFASLDSSNAITVDKPPGAMWIMGLSGRIFEFSAASMLVPEALMGVATVALVHAGVKRWFGSAAGLVAGALVTLTPVAALMFRFNNPDAFLVLLMTAAGYCVIRALEPPSPVAKSRALRWLLLAGTAIGFAFLTKMLQGLLVVPGFALAYLWAAPPRLWTRIWHLMAAMGAVIVSAGWFVVLVAVWPAGSRPYIGGSTDNSLWELAIGYNGLGRIFGGSGNRGSGAGDAAGGGVAAVGGAVGAGGGGGAGGGAQFGGGTGLTRMFGSAFGAQISWLIPAALIALVVCLVLSARAVRTDRTRAALLLWGGWLLVTGLVFSYMQGTVHPYYSLALTPAIAALVAIGGREMWRGRSNPVVRAVLAAMIAVTAIWSFHLMNTDAPTWNPWLRYVTLLGGLIGAVLFAASAARLQRLAAVGLVIGSVSALGGMTGWAVQTVSTDHTGSTPTAGPGTRSGMGGFGGRTRTGGGFQLPSGGQLPEGPEPPTGAGGAQPPAGVGGAQPPAAGQTPRGAGATRGGGAGGFGGATTVDSHLVALLDATTTRWAAAMTSATAASPYILASDKAVMAIGGFSGNDPSPTLAQFQQYVSSGQITYFISGGRSGFGGREGGSSKISSWVAAHFIAMTGGSSTVYDLRTPTTGP